VNIFGFITNKFVGMRSHMNVKMFKKIPSFPLTIII